MVALLKHTHKQTKTAFGAWDGHHSRNSGAVDRYSWSYNSVNDSLPCLIDTKKRLLFTFINEVILIQGSTSTHKRGKNECLF